MKKNLVLIIILVLVVLTAFLYSTARLPFINELPGIGGVNEPGGGATVSEGHRLGQAKTITGVTITPLAVTEDSRCAEGVQCIWAGTVKVSANFSKPSGNFTQTIELGKTMNTGTEEVRLVSVSPNPKVGETIKPGDYRFVFEVKLIQAATENPGKGGCYVGGCSGQICSEEAGVVSTCEWTEAYACYQTAKCERQSNGECGWTPTATLNMCLQNAR
jgi:hypothetical protein